MTKDEISKEIERQISNLILLGYPQIANLEKEKFLELTNPLRRALDNLTVEEVDIENGKLPFVIIVKNELIESEKMMALTQRNEVNGVTILRPHTSKDFKSIPEVSIPKSYVYLIVGVDRGKESINLAPNEAMKLIKSANRSPLTIDEGIAVITHFPEFLIKNNCFSLLASRTGKDQRVPAIWINSKKEPNLGWCWDGNPHTWLGSASCVERIDVSE